jgi:hypothetical protein
MLKPLKHLLKKAAFVLTLFHLSAILTACWCECDETDVPFNYDTVETALLDNSGEFTGIAADDTLSREAVAFRLYISGSLVADVPRIRPATFGYQRAYAWSCDCLIPHVPEQQIMAIRISEEDSDQEVTEQFVALTSRWNSNGLYFTLAEALDRLPQEAPYEGPGTYLDFFLTEAPAASKLNYVVEIELSDGRTLSALTPTIYLL